MSYDPEKCGAFAHNGDPPFEVPARGEIRITVDCSFCGGFIQNYQLTLMDEKRRAPKYSSMQVRDQTGAQVGRRSPLGDVVEIGSVPDGAVYTVIVAGGTKRERCVLAYTGAAT